MYKRAISRPAMSSAAAAATITALLTTLIVHTTVQAFQPTFPTSSSRLMHPTAAFVSPIVNPTTIMSYGPVPWDPEYGADSFHRISGEIQSRRDNRLGAGIFAPLGVFQDPGLRITDPEITDTEDSYQLNFSLPSDVEQNAFDVSVSGSLLTVKARITRETSGDDTGRRGGWVTRSSRTDSMSRSFVLPEGVSSSGVKTAWVSDGQVKVKFNKDNPNNTSLKAADEIGGGIPKTGTSKADTTSSTSTQSLASESTTKPMASSGPTTTDGEVGTAAQSEPTAKLSQSPASSPDFERPSRPRSMFDALDEEFGELAKAFWDQDALRFPTREETVKRAEAAREARARRATAMRRATMAVAVSETTDRSYLVRVALPEGAIRDDVSLSVLPEKALLRVTFAPDGHRSVYKDVRLPKNALLSEVSAKFDVEHENSSEGESSKGGRVSSLQITVGRSIPPEPKHIDIM